MPWAQIGVPQKSIPFENLLCLPLTTTKRFIQTSIVMLFFLGLVYILELLVITLDVVTKLFQISMGRHCESQKGLLIFFNWIMMIVFFIRHLCIHF
jgi:hypothetical protein